MSVHVLSWVLKNSAAEGTERLCMLVIANYADDEGMAYPGIERIAKEMRVSPRTAQRAIAGLAEKGFIRVDCNGAPDRRMRADRRTNAYWILRGDGGDAPRADDGVTPGAPRGDSGVADGVSALSPKPSVEPSGEPSSSSTGVDGDAFDDFWNAYPKRSGKRVGKAQAHERWRRLSKANRALAMLAVEHYRAACDGGLTIACDAQRWLSRRSWEDWQEPADPGAVPPNRNGSAGAAAKRQPEALPEGTPHTARRIQL